MKVAVAGTGYVGLVTGVVLAELGHDVTCVDPIKEKVNMLKNGICPIYEDGVEELMYKNKERLTYTTDYKNAYRDADVIIIGVGTPERVDGSANLDYVYSVAEQIAETIEKDCVVVVKSTVPIGTNDEVEALIKEKLKNKVNVFVASNPEFLAQGTALHDTLYAKRIVVGTEDKKAEEVMRKLYLPLTKEPYNVPYLAMDRKSAELSKYACNNFLALKISYINEIANLCQEIGGNIDHVTEVMGLDNRIGNKFLNAGCGYGGSCFPKDTKALNNLSESMGLNLLTVQATIDVNERQKTVLFYDALEDGIDFNGQKVAILGATFKPGTDDLREAPAIENIKLLLDRNANIYVYDPVGLNNLNKIFGNKISYCDSIDEALKGAICAFIITEWKEIKEYPLNKYSELMDLANVYDGRNCYLIDDVKKHSLNYSSIGRPKVFSEEISQ